MTEITAYLIVQIVTQMYTVTVSRLVALINVFNHSYFVDPYNSIATQLSAEQITVQMAIVKISINLYYFIRFIRGYDIAAKWSAIVILGLSFTPSLANITTFTMTLASKPHCSTSYNQRSLPLPLLVVKYYIYMLLP
jgi:hypothetical protein